MDVKYKYAIVRVKESSVIDFFGLILFGVPPPCTLHPSPTADPPVSALCLLIATHLYIAPPRSASLSPVAVPP
ncbi:unnamed protein product [Nippostrongylus brasiliensis]|uniref:Uncharacterized protein n=1 Tax=Nippostrongylus brasiliensis TaxID=27835 RepID=A0A0N4YC21_NIPBR|nr:unnamed protein product [Nippostrongylus brasiliensis]